MIPICDNDLKDDGQETPEPSEECPHYQDNQGFCHQCGILMCKATAELAGYFRDGMIEGQ